jgi:hypothetical protein
MGGLWAASRSGADGCMRLLCSGSPDLGSPSPERCFATNLATPPERWRQGSTGSGNRVAPRSPMVTPDGPSLSRPARVTPNARLPAQTTTAVLRCSLGTDRSRPCDPSALPRSLAHPPPWASRRNGRQVLRYITLTASAAAPVAARAGQSKECCQHRPRAWRTSVRRGRPECVC